MFKLDRAKQKKLFERSGYEDALMYALANASDELSEFEVDEATKQQVILKRTGPLKISELIFAAQRGKIEVVKLLLSWGADIEYRDNKNYLALHLGAFHGHIDVVKCLLKHKPSLIDSSCFGENTALHCALEGSHGEIAQLLIENGSTRGPLIIHHSG